MGTQRTRSARFLAQGNINQALTCSIRQRALHGTRHS